MGICVAFNDLFSAFGLALASSYVHGYGGSVACWEMTPDLSNHRQDISAHQCPCRQSGAMCARNTFGRRVPRVDGCHTKQSEYLLLVDYQYYTL